MTGSVVMPAFLYVLLVALGTLLEGIGPVRMEHGANPSSTQMTRCNCGDTMHSSLPVLLRLSSGPTPRKQPAELALEAGHEAALAEGPSRPLMRADALALLAGQRGTPANP